MAKGSKVPKKLFVGIALAIAAGAIGWLAFGGIGENLVYYWTPTELRQAGDKALGTLVRLGGQVKPGSINWDKTASDLRFEVRDNGATVPVHSRFVPPQMFREGIGVVVEGRLSAKGIFESDRLLVKHGNEYKPPVKGQHKNVKALMKSVTEGDGR